MKRVPLLLILTALAVSLWFNWHPRPPVEVLAAPPTAPSPVVSGKVEEMDFSGTGLADEAWKLKSATEESLPAIPQALPQPGEEDPAPPPPGDWELEDKIKLAPGAAPR